MLTDLNASPAIGLLDPRTVPALELLYTEARLLDEKKYDEWNELWAEGPTRYVIPIDRDADEYDAVLNFVNDDAAMRHRRVARMTSGHAGAVTAVERTVRTLSRFELNATGTDEVEVRSAEIVVAYKRGQHQLWAADLVHRIDLSGERPRIRQKIVHLIDAAHTVRTCGFLL